MKRLALHQDVRPLSEFRANATAFLQQVKDTRRPLVITQHGRSAAVLLEVSEYEEMVDKIELLQEILAAENELREGKGVAQKTAKKQVLAQFEEKYGK